MKKIIALLSLALLPAITFAHGYQMMNTSGYNWGSSESSTFGIFLFFLLPLIWVVFSIGLFVFWVVMLIDAIKHAPEKMKLIWVLVIVFTNIIGALIYYFVEKKPRMKHGHKE